jgi:hypothetical protein
MEVKFTRGFDRNLFGLDELVQLPVLPLFDGGERVSHVVQGEDGDVEGTRRTAGPLENDAANVVVPIMEKIFFIS